jgi:hypothetical protein
MQMLTVNLQLGVPKSSVNTDKFTPFFRCKRRTHVSIIALPDKFIVLDILTYRGLVEFVVQDGWPLCDFQEDIYSPKSHWPSEEDVQAFESGEKPWPCDEPYRPRCKCGILARKGVVPSELGYGWYCGNSYGDYWVKSLSYLCIHVLCQFKWLCCLKIDINFLGGENM